MALLAATLLAAAGCAPPDAPPRRGGPEDLAPLTRYVDPFIGTGGHGHVYAGATVPWGMVQLSPDNGRDGWDWVAGYHYSDSVIVGFSHTHLSGTGIGDLLDVLVMPVSAPVEVARHMERREDRPYRSRFSHDREAAAPGYYAVDLLDAGIRAELTATPRVGVHRYTFPASEDAGIVLDLGYAQNWDRAVETGIRIHDDTLVTGFRRSTGWARDQRVFFALVLSRPVTRVELADDSVALEPYVAGGAAGGAGRARAAETPDGAGRDADRAARASSRRTRSLQAAPVTARGTALRALLRLGPTRPGEEVLVKVALSYVDEAGALANLRAEAPGWDFDGIRESARRAWERELRKVRLRGGTERQRRIFYTALYRTRLAPILFQDVDGRYRGGDGEVHRTRDFTNYSIFSLWDTFRAQHPLLTILDPERVGDMVNSMLAFGDEYGFLPVWSLVGNETNTMTGHHALPVIADAYLKGIGGFDPERALEAMVRAATADHRGIPLYEEYGYIPSEMEVESVTKTLEYAFDDWAVAAMADALGRDSLAFEFRARARSWRNVFDPETRFMRGKRADGTWVTPFDPRRSSHRERTDYTEGNAWQHTWFVPHDVRGLILAMGGDGPFVAKLDSLFEADTVVTGENVSPDISGLIGQYAHGNEPSHHIAYLYSFAGAPWKTADRVREILETRYGDGPDGLAGNEDCGQMSAWYVLSALGFYPVNPVGGVYVLGSPLFPEAILDVGGGRTFTIRAPGVSERNRYVQSARLNGRPYTKAYLLHSDLVKGGVLELVMGPEPSDWGTARQDRPPSVPPLPAPARARRAEAVRAEFRHAWEAYRTYAWGHDALRPLSRTSRDWYGTSLYMTPVDAFDALLLLGMEREAADAKALVLDSLSFDRNLSVQVFEVTIRLLGGLLAAYEMEGEGRFLALARDLGDRLLPAFRSPTGMPYRFVNLRTGEPTGPVSNPAEIGTLTLEFGTLSRLTGDPRYYEAAKQAVEALFRRRSAVGLVGTAIDVETGEWVERESHLSGRIDSYYEYLLKAWLLFGDPDFREMWEASLEPVHRYLADEVRGELWYGHVDMDTGRRRATRFGALDAFWPAVLALAGDLERAERLQESVFRMWTTFDVEPEELDYATMEILNPAYPLRPEALESAYYLWRLTGDGRYREMGWDLFQRVRRWARRPVGYAHLRSVVTKEPDDDMESFFLAETLKYAYLLQAPPETLPFEEMVFNTEAHPLQRRGEGWSGR